MILKEFSDWQKEGLGYKKISQDDSRDEQIIKGIYNALKYLELENSWDILCDEPYVDILDVYDWLEKQGQTFTKKDVDDAYLKGVCDAKHEIEKQGEQSNGIIEPRKVYADKVIAWLVANICDYDYYVKLFKKDFKI